MAATVLSPPGVVVGGLPVEADLEATWVETYGPRDGVAGAAPLKPAEAFRDYKKEARPSVRKFYEENHTKQTLEFVLAKKKEFLGLNHRRMSVWEAMEFLNTLVDDSDPDTSLTQIEHLLQTAEAIRRDGHPRWFILTGLIHDLGKILCLWGEPQWAVVGDTNPVGCKFSDRIVYSEFFAQNPDNDNAALNTKLGIYTEHCGLDQVHMSWSHDEYMYQVCRTQAPKIPQPALYMIRYHSSGRVRVNSFYSQHRENAYDHLMNDKDREMFEWVKKFNPYDLYSKADAPPSVAELKPFYEELIAEFFPAELNW